MYDRFKKTLESSCFKGFAFALLMLALFGLLGGKKFLATFIAGFFMLITMLYFVVFLVNTYKTFKGFKKW